MGGSGERWVDPSSIVFEVSGSGVSVPEEEEDVALPVPVPVPVPVDLLVNVEDVGTVVPTAERLRVAFFLAEELVVDMMILSICDARLSDESFRRSSGLDAAAALSPPVTPAAGAGVAGPGDSDSDSDGDEAIGG